MSLQATCVRVEDLAYDAKAITEPLYGDPAAVIDTDADPNQAV
jgi:hypothetical protein